MPSRYINGQLYYFALDYPRPTHAPDARGPAQPLSAVLDPHGLSHIDLLSLDVEGYEPSALRGLDLERHRPTFIVVEAWSEPELDGLGVLISQYAVRGDGSSMLLWVKGSHSVATTLMTAALPSLPGARPW